MILIVCQKETCPFTVHDAAEKARKLWGEESDAHTRALNFQLYV